MDPTVTADDFTALDGFFVGLKVDPGEVFLDQGMRGRLADEDEMPVDGENLLAQRLAGKEIIAEINRIEPGIVRPVGPQPPLGGGILAVLFLRAILRAMNSGSSGMTLSCPGATRVAPSIAWKHSFSSLPRCRVEQL